ncbi:MAG TPA: DUF2304 domain-containing protein [Hyphomicrobiaceae bacterium]|nr:DUF2304 domain-containing protein [Hyphomicrobiaceae bacterium]
MDFRIQALSVVVGVLICALVLIALKRARLYPAYAVLWSGIGILLILLPLYGNLLSWLATNVFGIVGGNHLIYAMLFGFLLIYLFYMTQKVCQLFNRVERIIIFLAILETWQSEGSRRPSLHNPDPDKSNE